MRPKEIEKIIILNGKKVRVSVATRTISKEEFERRITPLLKEMAKKLK